MAGSEDAQVAWLQQHGTDMASCADNPSGAACQKAQNEANAVAFAMASAGLIYLPGGMPVTAGIGGTANAGIQYLINGTVNPTDVLIASYVGAFTANTGFYGTVGWNAAGGATSNWLKGDDPLMGAAGSAVDYGIDNKIVSPALDKYLILNGKIIRGLIWGWGLANLYHHPLYQEWRVLQQLLLQQKAPGKAFLSL